MGTRVTGAAATGEPGASPIWPLGFAPGEGGDGEGDTGEVAVAATGAGEAADVIIGAARERTGGG
jgi:hypothetical protein